MTTADTTAEPTQDWANPLLKLPAHLPPYDPSVGVIFLITRMVFSKEEQVFYAAQGRNMDFVYIVDCRVNPQDDLSNPQSVGHHFHNAVTWGELLDQDDPLAADIIRGVLGDRIPSLETRIEIQRPV